MLFNSLDFFRWCISRSPRSCAHYIGNASRARRSSRWTAADEVFNRVPAYRYRNTVDAVIKAALTREDVRPHFVQGHAYVEFSRASGALRAHDAEFDARQFDSFLAFCDAQAIPVLVFEPPNSPGYSAGTRNREPVLANIGAVMARHPNARFVSYDAESADYAPAEWLNLNHLNHRGADKFSLRLSARIAEALHSSAGE